MNKIISGIIIIVILLAFGSYYLKSSKKDVYTNNDTMVKPEAVYTDVTEKSSETPVKQKIPDVLINNTQNIIVFSMEDVARNNNESSCWSVVGDKVYNLTEWIKQHPGGPQKIISICGKDGTKAFEGQHMGDKKPAEILVSFFIGNLK